MAHKEEEIWYQNNSPAPFREVVSTTNLFEILQKPVGRFLRPKSSLSYLGGRFWKMLSVFLDGFFGATFLFVRDAHIPPSWKELIRDLLKRGLTHEPLPVFMDLPNDAPKIFTTLFNYKTPEWSDGNNDLSLTASTGFSVEPETAISKGVGELLERRAFLEYKEKDFIFGSYAELKARGLACAPIFSFSVFSKEQKKNSRLNFDENSKFFWVRCVNLVDRKKCLIPAQLIFWNYDHDHKKSGLNYREPILREANTNGAGGFFTLPGAVISGLLELVQRDAFLWHWLTKTPPRKISINSIKDVSLEQLIRSCERYRLRVHVLELVAEIAVPTFAVLLEHVDGKIPQYTVGASSAFNPEDAILQALSEALVVNYFSRIGECEPPLQDSYVPFSDPSMYQKRRLDLWANPLMKPQMDFLLGGKESDIISSVPAVTYRDENDALDAVLSFVKAKGYHVYCYESRHPYLKDFGFRAVKVIVPELIHFYLSEALASLGAERLKGSVLNKMPHPFP